MPSLALGLALAGSLAAGPGLLVRNAERYYKPPLRRVLHGEENLPPEPPPELAAPFQERDLFALRDAGYLDGYQGPDWNRAGPCSRYQAAFLLGGLFAEISRVHGAVLREGDFGPPRVALPRIEWGRERVLLVSAQGILRPKSLPWWDEPPDRFQVAGWIEAVLTKLDGRIVVVRDPRPYGQAGTLGDLPYWGHPLRRRVQRVLEAHLMVAEGGRFRGSEALGAREWVRILERIRTVIDGYRQRIELAAP